MPGAHLDVERLLQEAAARRPELGQLEDELLQCHHVGSSASGRGASRASTRADFSSFSRCRLDQAPVRGLELARRRAVDSGNGSSRSGAADPAARQKLHRLDDRSVPPPDGAHRRHTNMCSRGGITAPRIERRRTRARRAPDRRPAAAAASTRSSAPAARSARRRQSRRPSTRRAGYSRSSACASGAHSSISSAKYPTCPSAVALRVRRRRQRRPHRLDVVEPHQLALLALEVRHARRASAARAPR